ncbi:MAG: hypothetical protein JJT95_02660 [Pararhodobacter sp.]|nr:hypothetical protein [Pararhodobacter sp.]
MTLRAQHILIAVIFSASPLAAQQTIEIPREQIEALPDMSDLPVPQLDLDLSSPEGLLRSIEAIVSTDWTDTLPEAVTEMILGATPFEAHAGVVWEMQVTGSWNETIRGAGTLNVYDQTALGAAQGRQFYALLESDARDWPFHLFAFVPDSAPAVARRGFSGPGDGHPGGGTGFSQLANHMFEADRVVGHATPQGMRARSFAETTDDDFTGDYLYTEVQGGRIRVDSSGNAYRMHFSATVQEFDSDNRQPTGRSARQRGWVCEAAAYEADPDSCLYDDFQIIDHTPPAQRANVNPAHPAVTVTFSAPVDARSLVDSFSLFTVGADGERIEVAGGWRQSPHPGAWREDAAERAAQIQPQLSPATCSQGNISGLASHEMPSLGIFDDPQEYTFHPATPLRPGTTYEVHIAGGEDGVRAQDGDEYLDEDLGWRFSTLLHMEDQLSDMQDDPLRLHVFQTVRDPALVTDKPALTRVYPDWTPHDDIAPDWQPERFEFELAMSEHHPRVVAQHALPARLNRLAWLEPQAAFDDDDQRHARHSVNFFGWMPQPNAAEMLELVACPHDPFPHPMPQAETRQEHPVEIWDHDPGDLDFYYVIAELGPWATALEQRLRMLLEPEGTLGARENPIESIREAFEAFIEELAEAETGIPEADRQMILQTLWRAEEYAPQFLPYRSARARPTGLTIGSFSMWLSSWLDPRANVSGFVADSDLAQLLLGDDAGTRIRLGAYIRWLQRMARDHIGPEDFLVVVVPSGVLSEGTLGIAATELENFRLTGFMYKGLLDYRARAVVMAIDDNEHFDADMLATGLVHEFGHALSLPHFPGENPPASFRRDPGINGFRLHASGLYGWNKSFSEGNAEDPDILRSLMWPTVQPSASAWLSEYEYSQVQRDIQIGFGQRDAWLRDLTIRTAQATPPTYSDAVSPPADRLIVTGLITPEGGAFVDPLRSRPARASADRGQYRAELLDANGRVLRSTAFEPETRSIHPLRAMRLGGAGPDNPLLWPEFRVAIEPHPGAAALLIRNGAQELARITAPGAAPELRVVSDMPVAIGPADRTISWEVRTDGPVVFDVEYSATGEAPWRPLALLQTDSAIALNAGSLAPGPHPYLRITAQSGLHSTRQMVPVTLTRPPEPVSVDLPDPESALLGIPPNLRFDTELSPEVLEAHLELLDGAGERLDVDYLHLAAQRSVSLLPLHPLAPDATYSLRLAAGFHDAYGNTLEGPLLWEFSTAQTRPAPP